MYFHTCNAPKMGPGRPCSGRSGGKGQQLASSAPSVRSLSPLPHMRAAWRYALLLPIKKGRTSRVVKPMRCMGDAMDA